ncbi:Hypothetical protein PACV_117 [Pacmanvirus A23]|uniref:Hypothetical protein n=1 Tax=Pacmanvirus A23 TaxID=1932881 RepID=UPI000A091F35|nr:Hypothetical protein B9W72_gp116 [Pacmanvirus A23]SIP85833.1 Hypothetical protein PACV_117 [Pacmanvirus A23]
MEAHKLAFNKVLTDINNIEYEIINLKTSEAKIASYRTVNVLIGRKTLDSIKKQSTPLTKLQTIYELTLPCESINNVNTKHQYTDILISRSNMMFIGKKLSRNWLSYDSLSMSRFVRWEFVNPSDFKWLKNINTKIEPYCGVIPGMEISCYDPYSEMSVGTRLEYCHSLYNGMIRNYISFEENIIADIEYKKKKAEKNNNP